MVTQQTNVQTHHGMCWNLKNTSEQVQYLPERGGEWSLSSLYCRSLQVVESCLCFSFCSAVLRERDLFSVKTLLFDSLLLSECLSIRPSIKDEFSFKRVCCPIFFVPHNIIYFPSNNGRSSQRLFIARFYNHQGARKHVWNQYTALPQWAASIL